MIQRFVTLSLIGLATAVFAQTPATPTPAPGGNAVINGTFLKFKGQENLWDGVDAQGFLAGNAVGAYAVTESGRIGTLAMPMTAHFTDMNGDKLPDLVSCDPSGILRVHFNSGTPTAPKFTHAEVVPLFPPQVAKDDKWDRGWWTWPHSIPKITLFDWRKRGTLDLFFGNYTGDVVMVDNTGSATEPAFAQPTTYAKARVPIGEKPWGNLLAPCVYDWNKDGKPDMLIGEGSYSANAVYVLLNQSNGSEPKFTDERHYLCYGDGREQLVPTVVDYNADGEPDVIVGDRLGTVGVYLNPGKWKPGTELPLAQLITFGTVQKLGVGVAPHVCDFNGDGLFDLMLGKSNGRVAIALNTGTKTEPKFGAATEIKGVNMWSNDMRLPDNWTVDPGNTRGNLYAYTSVQEETTPGGGKVLKSGYYPTPNKVIKMVPLGVDGADSTDFFRYWWDQWYPISSGWAGSTRTTESFLIRQNLIPLKVGATYQLSFKVRGTTIKEGVATVAYLGANENVPTKFAANSGGRGSKALKDEAHEEIHEVEKFTSSAQWKTVEKTFSVRFRDKSIKALDTTTLAIIEFKFELPQYTGVCEIADVQVMQKPAVK
ncbi:MAG: VCBS repeat-containing protein [Chthoniobacteraceae bacterium]